MINNRAWIWMMAFLVLLTGCDDQRILEKTGFIQSTSYDYLSKGGITYGLSLPIANPETKANRGFLKTDATSSKQARIQLSRETNLKLVSGQLRTTLFGLKIAREGIWDIMDTLIRDPTISEKIKIIIVNGDAADLLGKNYKTFPRTGQYIDRLIQKESAAQSTPLTTLYSFSRDYHDDGIDPVVPIIKDNGDTIKLDGIAIFEDDKYKGKINPDDAIIFAFLHGNFNHGEITFNLPGGSPAETVMLSSLNSSRKVNVNHDKGGRMNVVIRVHVKASILEYLGELKLSDDADRHKLERTISDLATHRAERVLKILQRNNADSLGIGTHVRNSMTYSNWKQLDWHKKYPDIQIKCEVKIKIKDYGFRR